MSQWMRKGLEPQLTFPCFKKDQHGVSGLRESRRAWSTGRAVKNKRKQTCLNTRVWWNVTAARKTFFIGPHPLLLSDEVMVKPETGDETLRAPLV